MSAVELSLWHINVTPCGLTPGAFSHALVISGASDGALMVCIRSTVTGERAHTVCAHEAACYTTNPRFNAQVRSTMSDIVGHTTGAFGSALVAGGTRDGAKPCGHVQL